MSAVPLSAAGLAQALANVATLPAVDAAVEKRAEAVAAELARTGAEATIVKRGAGSYAVTVSGADVFTREFGGVDTPAEPFVAAALERAGRP